MASPISEDVHTGVRDLIAHITRFKPGCERFRSLERSVLTTLRKSDTMSFQNSREIRRSVWSMADKFAFHGFRKHSEYLKQSHDKYVEEELSQGELTPRLNVVRFLLSMSYKPTTRFWESPELFDFINKRSVEDDVEDWAAYLNEGVETWSPDKDQCQEQSDLEFSDSEESSVKCELPSRVVITQDCQLEEYDFQALHSELNDTVQHSWFSGEVVCMQPPSQWFDANMGILWEEHLKRQTHGLVEIDPVVVITEYKAIREILWQFFTLHSSTMFELSNNRLVAKPNVTISSVNATTFESFLSVFLEYAQLLEEFRTLHRSVEKGDVCETYKSYACGIYEIIKPIYWHLVDIESQVRQQSSTFTLLKLAKRLEEIFAPLHMLKALHEEVVPKFCDKSNMECALHLITRLRRSLRSSVNKMEQDVRLTLYLKSLFYYLTSVNAWLVKDDLFDHTHEFVVLNKNERNTKTCDSYEMNYVKRPGADRYCDDDGVVRIICDQVLQIGRNIHLLRLLNKFDVFVRSSESVYEEFLRLFLQELATYYERAILGNAEDFTELKRVVTSFDLNEMGDWTDYVNISNGFLMKAFEDFYTEKRKSPDSPSLFHKISSLTTNLFPLQDLPERVFCTILKDRFTISGLMVKNILIEKYGLESTFKFLCHVFLFWDDLIFPFYYRLFEKMNSVNSNWGNSIWLTSHLQDIFMDLYPSFYEECTVEVEDYWKQCRNSIEACKLLSIEYEIQWPLSIVLTRKHMQICMEIFRFILLLKWALYTTNHLSFSDLEPKGVKSTKPKSTVKLLKCLRFHLINLLNIIQHYLFSLEFSKHRTQFELDLEKSNDLMSLITSHDDFFRNIHETVVGIRDQEKNQHGFATLLECVKMLKVMWNNVDHASVDNLDECQIMFKKSYGVIDGVINPRIVFE